MGTPIGSISNRRQNFLETQLLLWSTPLRVLVLYANPVTASFGAALHSTVVTTLYYRAVGFDSEAYSRDEHSVEEAFQDRRKPLVPNRIDEYERLGLQQPIGISRDGRAIEPNVMILLAPCSLMTGLKPSA
jgi:hypothetical protein